MSMAKARRYSFTSYFLKVLEERLFPADEDLKAYILANCNNDNVARHVKWDDKGRHSEYITFSIKGVLATVVADADTKKLITVVRETHRRKQFNNESKNTDLQK